MMMMTKQILVIQKQFIWSGVSYIDLPCIVYMFNRYRISPKSTSLSRGKRRIWRNKCLKIADMETPKVRVKVFKVTMCEWSMKFVYPPLSLGGGDWGLRILQTRGAGECARNQGMISLVIFNFHCSPIIDLPLFVYQVSSQWGEANVVTGSLGGVDVVLLARYLFNLSFTSVSIFVS